MRLIDELRHYANMYQDPKEPSGRELTILTEKWRRKVC